MKEKQARVEAEHYRLRDKAQLLLSDKYKLCMAEIGKILKMTADRDNKCSLSVAMDYCDKKELIGIDQIMIVAAAVELAEPTT